MRTHGPLIAGRLPGPGTVLGRRGRSEVPKHVACAKKSRDREASWGPVPGLNITVLYDLEQVSEPLRISCFLRPEMTAALPTSQILVNTQINTRYKNDCKPERHVCHFFLTNLSAGIPRHPQVSDGGKSGVLGPFPVFHKARAQKVN